MLQLRCYLHSFLSLRLFGMSKRRRIISLMKTAYQAKNSAITSFNVTTYAHILFSFKYKVVPLNVPSPGNEMLKIIAVFIVIEDEQA